MLLPAVLLRSRQEAQELLSQQLDQQCPSTRRVGVEVALLEHPHQLACAVASALWGGKIESFSDKESMGSKGAVVLVPQHKLPYRPNGWGVTQALLQAQAAVHRFPVVMLPTSSPAVAHMLPYREDGGSSAASARWLW